MDTMTMRDLIADVEALGLASAGGRVPPPEMVDRWARAAALAELPVRQAAIWAVRQAARAAGVIPASIQDLYMARGRGDWGQRTVPAMNLRGWTYQTCRAALRAARRLDAGLLVFEQAPAEAIYAAQRPAEYTAGVLAAAMREGHRGPIFLQADHVQVNARQYAEDPAGETARLGDLIREYVAADFFNIDLDASTLVDLSRPTLVEQQRPNAEVTAGLTRVVRDAEPEGVVISVVAVSLKNGAHNTTPDELRAFMAAYPEALRALGGGAGISKVSVNSGTHHGGKVLPDGRLAEVTVAWDTLRQISDVGRGEFKIAGAVQHGASTLPMEYFSRFPETETVEIHLALGFNNLIFDHPRLPEDVKREIRDYVHRHHAAERKPDQTEAQFLYTTRKKAWAGMKQRFFDLPDEIQGVLMASLEGMFADMFERMRVQGTRDLVARFVRPRPVPLAVPEHLKDALTHA